MDDLRPTERWPLERGDTLSNHDWFPFYGHRFLASSFVARAVMQDRRADIGTAMILWSESMRQDPAGTLPVDDLELAALARFHSLAEWVAVRDGVLHGWEPVTVVDSVTGAESVRLGHLGMIQGIVAQMHRRKVSRDGARSAAATATRKSRIKDKLKEAKAPAWMMQDDAAIAALVAHFEQTNLYITAENVRAAMVSLLGYDDQVVSIKMGRGGV